MLWRWFFDLEHGHDTEHLRRQLYSLTVTLYNGIYFLLITVLEWPKEMSNRPDADRERVYLATSRDLDITGGGVDLRWVYAQKPLWTGSDKDSSKTNFSDYEAGGMLPASEIVTHFAAPIASSFRAFSNIVISSGCLRAAS